MIKMEQKRRIKGVNERDTKRVKAKAVIDIAIAAIILASVFVATVPMVSAESRGDNFNHIVVQPTPQKVLIGQNLQFEGFTDIAVVCRIVSGDIENMYQADANNRIYNVNWPTSGAFYVNYRSATDYDAQLSVEYPNMPLKLKVGTMEVSSIAVETNLSVDTAGMNLFREDKVNLVIIGPDGLIKYDLENDQTFNNITVVELSKYNKCGLKTNGWAIGDYTFQIETKPACACGLDKESSKKYLKIIPGEIAIEADKTSTIELQTLILTVTGGAGDKINVTGDSEYVIFKPRVDDTPDVIYKNKKDKRSWFNDVIDEDGIMKYAVKFTDTGSYTIKVTLIGGPRDKDYDSVDITVSEKGVWFDLPSTVVIGEKLDIRGIANTGTYVDIFVDDVLYDKLDYLLIGDDGTFSKEVRTTDVGMSVPGSVRLKAWLECAKRPGEEPPTRSADGSATILVLQTHLDARITNATVAPGGSFEVWGNASSDYVEIVLISPDGGNGTGMDGLYGTTIYTVPTYCNSTNYYNYYKKLKVDSDADNGNYTIIVLNSGRDNAYGDSAYGYIDSILDLDGDGPEPGVMNISNKTQEQIAAIISDMIYATGSDDFMWIGNIAIA